MSPLTGLWDLHGFLLQRRRAYGAGWSQFDRPVAAVRAPFSGGIFVENQTNR